MPTYSSSVDYSANSRSSNINVVHHENDSQQNGNATPTSQRPVMIKGHFPAWFDRSSNKWWSLRLDSKVLEDHYKKSSLLQSRNLFCQYSVFTSVTCGLWGIYFAGSRQPSFWIAGVVWALVLACICLICFFLSNRIKFYERYSSYINIAFLIPLIVTGLISAYATPKIFTLAGSFSVGSVVIFLMYLILSFPIPILFVLTVIFSIIFEVLLQIDYPVKVTHVISQSILLLCLHVIGLLLLMNLQIVRHSAFFKICRLIKATEEKEKEQRFKKFMIGTVMPLSLGEKLLKHGEKKENNKGRKDENNMFRPFQMERMENVSILYADIVGFTQMSSSKTAAELVSLLNDLFGRFDRLCEDTGCEKISTLGDCYYCVSGCPKSCDDHAKNCVNMGLGMISEIKKFCEEKQINVNMRVGIHTGYVLCGVVGTRRYKFDVWSNDVSLANGMEQHGVPGKVHVSGATLKCLEDQYEYEDSHLEERDKEFLKKTGKTYLIKSRINHNEVAPANNRNKTNGSEQIGSNNNPEQNHSTKEPLLLKPSTSKSDGISVSKPSSENNDKKASSSVVKKQDELSRYLEQHISPLFSTSSFLKMRREEDDQRFLDSVHNKEIVLSYQNKEVNKLTLQFCDSSIEENYRNECTQEANKDAVIEYTISTRFRFFSDMLCSSLFTFLLFFSSFLLLESDASRAAWIIAFVILFAVMVICTVLAGFYVFHTSDISKSSLLNLIVFLSRWSVRHLIGITFLLIPVAVVLSNISQYSPVSSCESYTLLLSITTLHFVNFNQLSTIIRSIFSVLIMITAFLIVFTCTVCDCRNGTNYSNSFDSIVIFIQLVIFVAVTNRHFELSYRLDYYCGSQFQSTTEDIKREADRVNQLLKNFIPLHVQKAMTGPVGVYSKTHEKVGVIFATIVNFNELYEESFEGGKEFLRFLSELISDVDDLLSDGKYKDIEKIKTIGTTFMLASGLNPDVDQESTGRDSHLCRLMDFCIDMQNVIEKFNKDMVNFHFVLRIGFNHGEVTAGVIGTTKRLYDIWGDTVNIASRMDSTGVPNRIQVSDKSRNVLKSHFTFDCIGEKFVKGKGMMKTYLLVRDDEERRKIIPNPTQNYQLF